MMGRRWRGRGGMMRISRTGEEVQEVQEVVQEGMVVKFPLVPVATFSATASIFFPARRY